MSPGSSALGLSGTGMHAPMSTPLHRRSLVAGAAAALLITLALLGADSASAKLLDSYCSPTGDYCTSVIQKHGRVKLHFGAFSFRGGYRVCVRGPHRTHVCHKSKLRPRGQDVYADQIDWMRRFPHRTKGRYHVVWFKHAKVGPMLKFNWKGHR